MRLIEKIILLLLGISLLPLMIIGSLFYFSVKATVENQTTEKLSSIATIQEHRLLDTRSHNLKRLADFTSRKQVRTLLDSYNQTGNPSAQSGILNILEDAKKLGQDVETIVVMDTSGKVVASTGKEAGELQPLAHELYDLGRQENSLRLFTKDSDQHSVFYVSGPLILDGKIVGVAGLEISADELLKTVADHTGLGETGEIYLGQRLNNGELEYITPHRFGIETNSRAINNSNLPMYKTLMGEEATFPDIKDYRGQPVFAVTRSIGDSGWGLVAKIDRAEAFQPLKSLRTELILLAFINSVLVVFAAIALARVLVQPILDIDEVAEQTSKGNLKNRIAHPSNDEIGNLAGTFNAMLDNLEVFDKAKSDFVSLASHQLRTPLTSIKWAAESLMSPKARLGKDKQKKYLNQIHASNERMIELVNALLNVSKIDVGTLPYNNESVQLEDTLMHVITDLQVLAKSKNISIYKKLDKNLVMIDMDPVWMRLILQNLLSNAIRYSIPDHAVDIIINQKADHVIIQVKDRGYGIPAVQQASVFKKFFRADNAQRLGSDGSGLGLYMTKAMVERAGGSIWFESIQNKGTTFYVKLPSNK